GRGLGGAGGQHGGIARRRSALRVAPDRGSAPVGAARPRVERPAPGDAGPAGGDRAASRAHRRPPPRRLKRAETTTGAPRGARRRTREVSRSVVLAAAGELDAGGLVRLQRVHDLARDAIRPGVLDLAGTGAGMASAAIAQAERADAHPGRAVEDGLADREHRVLAAQAPDAM